MLWKYLSKGYLSIRKPFRRISDLSERRWPEFHPMSRGDFCSGRFHRHFIDQSKRFRQNGINYSLSILIVKERGEWGYNSLNKTEENCSNYYRQLNKNETIIFSQFNWQEFNPNQIKTNRQNWKLSYFGLNQ